MAEEQQKELTTLVVDDDEQIRDLLASAIRRGGIEIIDCVATTSEGLELIAKRNYNIIFTDLNQKPSGIEVYKNGTERNSQVYIITGYAPDAQEAQRIAPDHLILKPFSGVIIVEIVKDYIQRQNPPSQS